MKASELRSKDAAALKKELNDLLREQFNLRMQKATGQLGRTHQLQVVRRNIARVKSVINEQSKGEKA
jgi:large subunit ribosomal protein L29